MVQNPNFTKLFPIHYIEIGETSLIWARISRAHLSYLDMLNPANWATNQKRALAESSEKAFQAY